jgi:3-mercaptopyruvate sulfurtransferase SseA
MKTATRPDAPPRDRSAADVLVSADWLEAHLQDPAVHVVEVDVSRLAHDEWHIDGAVLWNIYADLKDPGYRLVDAAAVQRLLARSGIGRSRPWCATDTGRPWVSG